MKKLATAFVAAALMIAPFTSFTMAARSINFISEALGLASAVVQDNYTCINDLKTKTYKTKVKLIWTRLKGTERYDIFRSEETDPSNFVKIGETTSKFSKYTDNDVNHEHTYLYRIGAVSKKSGICNSNVTSAYAGEGKTGANFSPIIYSEPATGGRERITYNYDVNATDPNGDPLVFNLSSYPAGMAIDSVTGLIKWTPTQTQVGSHTVVAEASDGKGGTDTQEFTIKIEPAYFGECKEGQIRSCATRCGTGQEYCVKMYDSRNTWHGCDAPRPEDEICDGKDNNCDGKIDEGFERGADCIVSLPKVTGLRIAEAKIAIEDADLIVGSILSISHDSVPAGYIISQSPASGTLANKGSKVRFWVSLGPCDPELEPGPPNPVSIENQNPGNPPSAWDFKNINDRTNDPKLTGFTTDISYAPGEMVEFKIKNAYQLPYELKIYRMGYYNGDGARLIHTISQPNPVNQPSCIEDANHIEPVDCSNWSVTDSWQIPLDAVSGVYIAQIDLPDPLYNGSHILFVIRDDEGGSDILFQTDDATWQAYNPYPKINQVFGVQRYTGLYNGAVRVSYNRPDGDKRYVTSFFGAQYQMVRWLERNGYDVSYCSGVDTARSGSEIAEHKVFVSAGHDEYWSREMRDNVEAARNAGTHLAFFSGNLMYWKTRWEDNYRTMVCYKTTNHQRRSGIITELSPEDPCGFTGTWRDFRFQKANDLAEPENALTGTIFGSNGGRTKIQVPEADGNMRLWRGTIAATLSACAVARLAPETDIIGFEWDFDNDNGFRPEGLFRLSTTTKNQDPALIGPGTMAAGSLFGGGASANHHLVMYRHPSGSLVFNAGTVQWSWGLDDGGHLINSSWYHGTLDPTITQATVNLFADMGVQPATPADGVCLATASADTTPPVSLITAPSELQGVRIGSAVKIAGTASDNGGRVAGIEVSVDGGMTWHRAEGRENWHYTWMASEFGQHTLMSRAVDDSGNLEDSPGEVSVQVDGQGMCSIWPKDSPQVSFADEGSNVELGVRFRSDFPGNVSGVYFYAASSNTGPHQVHLWDDAGNLLAAGESAQQSNEGWRIGLFPQPVAIDPNKTYVVSYHTSSGSYAYTAQGLKDAQYRQPLAALGGGGVFSYGSSPKFPNQTYNNLNYWVDVAFEPGSFLPRHIFHGSFQPMVPNFLDSTAAADDWGVELGLRFRTAVDGYVSGIRFYRADESTPQIVNLWRDPSNIILQEKIIKPVAGSGLLLASNKVFASIGSGWQTIPLAQPVPIFAGGNYVVSYHTRKRYAFDWFFFSSPVSDPPLIAEKGVFRYGKTAFPDNAYRNTNYWVDVEFTPTAPFEYSIWEDGVVPPDYSADPSEVEVGLRFAAEVAGYITGIRFYRHPENNGTHIATLWSDSGNILASAPFTDESPCGWQSVKFSQPVQVSPFDVYVVSYHTTTGYAYEHNYFERGGDHAEEWSPPLKAYAGVYKYGSSAFPSQQHKNSNYWVDVMFQTAAGSAETTTTPVRHYPLP